MLAWPVRHFAALRLRSLAQSILGVVLLMHALPSAAACYPASCDAVFACGFRECVGATCETFAEDAGTQCRSAGGVCDLAESCNGTSTSCPTDRKRSNATICRSSSDACDVAERCDGTSNECPADTGNAPEIDSVLFLTGTRLADGAVQDHIARVEVRGQNLCSGSFSAPAAAERVFEPESVAPTSRLIYLASYADTGTLAADFPPGTYSFEFNGGTAAGTLSFFATLQPDGSLEILAPADGAVEGSDPTFTVENHCSNCPFARFALENELGVLVGTQIRDGTDLPLATPVDLSLAQVSGSGPPLPDGDYAFDTEAISGVFLGSQTLEGDSSHQFFAYVRGTALVQTTEFSVPEPSGGAGPAAAAMTLRWMTRRRRRDSLAIAVARRDRGRSMAGMRIAAGTSETNGIEFSVPEPGVGSIAWRAAFARATRIPPDCAARTVSGSNSIGGSDARFPHR